MSEVLPAGWRQATLGQVAKIRNGADASLVEAESGRYPVYGSGGEFRRASRYLFDGASVLFGRKGTVDRPLLVEGRFWTVDTMYYTEINSLLILPHFLYFCALQFPFASISTATALPSVTQSDLRRLQLPLPPLEQQARIVAALAAETAEIDAFIADQEQLIALLEERRTAAAAAVFWNVLRPSNGGARLAAYLVERDERVGVASRSLLSVSIHDGVRLANEEGRALELAPAHYKRVEINDVVLNRMRAFQGAVGVSKHLGATSPDYAVLRRQSNIDLRFLDALVRSDPFISAMAERLRGIGSGESGTVRTPRVNVADVLRIGVVLPSLDEQKALAAALDAENSSIDAAIADARDAIALSKERRSALISAAVSGQIDVTERSRVLV